MRVAFDTFNLGVSAAGGNKTYTVELIRALGGLGGGDEWRCVTYWRKRKACESIFGAGPSRPVSAALPHPLILGRGMRSCVKALYPLFEAALSRRCDLFHCTNPINFPSAMPRVVTTIHDLIALHDEPWVPPNAKIDFRKSIGRVIERSSALLAVSDFTRFEVVGRFPAAEGKIATTPLAARPFFRPVGGDRSFLSRYGIPDTSRPYLLSVGEIMQRKNSLAIIETFESLAGRFRGLGLVIVGQARKNDYTDALVRHVSASPVRDRIHILHSVSDDDLVRFYNHAEGAVYFSLFEGFGLPIVEAMACGCPVAASRSSSMTEIADGAAVMVDPRDAESMRHGMLRLIDDRALREELKKKGITRAARYSWKKTAELTYECYTKLLRGSTCAA